MRALSIEQACDALRVRPTMLFKILSAGQLKAKKIGRRTIILQSEIDRYLNDLPDDERSIVNPDTAENRRVMEAAPRRQPAYSRTGAGA